MNPLVLSTEDRIALELGRSIMRSALLANANEELKMELNKILEEEKLKEAKLAERRQNRKK